MNKGPLHFTLHSENLEYVLAAAAVVFVVIVIFHVLDIIILKKKWVKLRKLPVIPNG